MNEVFDSFQQLYVAKVMPLKKNNPTWLRVDGGIIGGNPGVFGYFLYKGKKWRINLDTRIEQIDKAYKSISQGVYPFVIQNAKKSKCLVLKEELASRPKHIYIYGS